MSGEVSWLIPLVLLVGIFFAFNPTESFWLDETITAWIAASPWNEISNRVFAYQAQSPLYYWLAGFIVHFLGRSEWLLRLPSWLAALGSLAYVYSIARRRLSISSARAAVLLLLAHTEFQRGLISARPYSIALFFALGALSYFLTWGDSGERRALVFASVYGILSFYAHYLIAFSLAPILVVVFLTSPRRGENLLSALTAAAICFLVMIPGLFHLREMSALVKDYSFAPAVSLKGVMQLLVPLNLMVTFVMAAAMTYSFYGGIRRQAHASRTALVQSIAYIIIPVALITVISLISGHSILVGRYAILASVGGALCGGWLVDKWISPTDRNAFCMTFAFIALFIHQWKFEDWRAMANYVAEQGSADSLVLLHSGMSEAERESWLLDTRASEYLTAPLRIYRVPGTIVPVPKRVEENDRYMKVLSDGLTTVHGKLFLVNLRNAREYGSNVQSSLIEHYQKLLKPIGFTPGTYWSKGLLEVLEVSRPAEKSNHLDD